MIARHGQLLLADQHGGQYRVLNVASDWLYHSPAFSPDGSKVAVVRQRQGAKPQIVKISTEELTSNIQTPQGFTLLVANNNNSEQFADLVWSPDGKALAYTEIDQQNVARVWILEKDKAPKLLTIGSHPTWSPDGTKMVVQRALTEDNSMLALIDITNGTERLLGAGEQPVWSAKGYLAFVSTSQQERVLTFMPDGSPQFTVRQRVGEIRSVYAGSDGRNLLPRLNQDKNWLASSTLLVSPDGGSSNKEMEWLRQMELQGVREPRVLLLDKADKCHNPVFGLQGNRLFYARQEEGAGTVLLVDLAERLLNRGEK